MKESKFVKSLGLLYKDLIKIKIEPTDTFEKSTNDFYKVMEKWGICQGTWTSHGSRCVSNSEWTICWQTFRSLRVLNFSTYALLTQCGHEGHEGFETYKEGDKPFDIQNLSKVYEDIYSLKFEPKNSFESSLNTFFVIMEKWNMKRSLKEWNMCWIIYTNQFDTWNMWDGLMSNPPTELLGYGKQKK
jgi:hypothetical protein